MSAPLLLDAETLPPGSLAARDRLLTRLWRDRNGRVGVVVTALVVIIGVLGATGLVPHDPIAQSPAQRLRGPSATYWFGTDQFGRDIASRVAAGVWASLRVAVLSVAIAAAIGSTLGIIAGYRRGRLDQIIGRLVDVLFAFPAILLALALVSALGSGWQNTMIAIAVVYTPIFARVSRGPTLTVAAADYIKAQRVLGIPAWRVLLRHVLPNVSPPIVVQITLALSWAILSEAALSFLGLGTQPPAASLGRMVADAQDTAQQAWWTLAFPAVTIVVAVIGLNLLGDGLRAALDPRRESRA